MAAILSRPQCVKLYRLAQTGYIENIFKSVTKNSLTNLGLAHFQQLKAGNVKIWGCHQCLWYQSLKRSVTYTLDDVNVGSGIGLVLSGNKPLPKPMLTLICVTVWC